MVLLNVTRSKPSMPGLNPNTLQLTPHSAGLPTAVTAKTRDKEGSFVAASLTGLFAITPTLTGLSYLFERVYTMVGRLWKRGGGGGELTARDRAEAIMILRQRQPTLPRQVPRAPLGFSIEIRKAQIRQVLPHLH